MLLPCPKVEFTKKNAMLKSNHYNSAHNVITRCILAATYIPYQVTRCSLQQKLGKRSKQTKTLMSHQL